MHGGYDPDILQDFLTESGELLDELEGDLVDLESTPDDLELLNKAFRALHTIKGSASFLEMTNLVSIAHAAETALNAARSGKLAVNREVMDLFLESVDLVKIQLDEVRSGADLTEPDAKLVDRLIELGEGRAAASAEGGNAGGDEPATFEGVGEAIPLVLPENKSDLLEFLLVDLEETVAQIETTAQQLSVEASRAEAASNLCDLGESLGRSAEFFEAPQLGQVAGVFERIGEAASSASPEALGQILPRVGVLARVVTAHAQGLGAQFVRTLELGALLERLTILASNDSLDARATLAENASEEDAIALDGVVLEHSHAAATPDVSSEPQSEASSSTPSSDADSAEPAGGQKRQQRAAAAAPEQTIRVEVGRLESLMNLVGELVLQKNRISALARRLDIEDRASADLIEEINVSASGLDRVTGDMQGAVMRTRMQPLEKLFGKYPRLIRDLAKKTEKQIDLHIEGGETEVDKSVIEELGDPLVHLLRNAADHGVEPPADRAASGKPEKGTIRIVASHEGSHVLVRIIDDGRGMDPDKIATKAMEKGLATETEIRAMTDRAKLRFILEPGFSTAAQVSDLSGRGVGMDVVKTNIEKLKGSIDLESTLGSGSVVSITIPLTVAIMPAMMIRVGVEVYAIPLGNVVEIVRPESANFGTIKGRPVLNLREAVLPVINGCDAFEVPGATSEDSRFFVVLQHAGRRFALGVTAPIGQQEVVIKPLDAVLDRAGPVSGATVRDDGGVSLIIDVAALAKAGETLASGGTESQSARPPADTHADTLVRAPAA